MKIVPTERRMTMNRYEVISFSRSGKLWFSVKDFKLERVYVLSLDEWLAHVEDFKKEGLSFGTLRRE